LRPLPDRSIRKRTRSFAVRRGASSRERGLVIIAIVCAGLLTPGTARAADPFGTADLMGEVNTAVAEAASVVPQEGGKTWTSAAPASSTSSLQRAVKVGASTLQAAATEAAAASTATTEASGSAAVPPATSVRSTAEVRVRAGPRVRTRTVRRASSGRSVSAASSLTLLTSSGRSVVRASATSRTTIVTHSARIRRAHDARPTRTVPAGAVPQQLPPVPLPPQDLTSSGQGGGQGQLMPLVVGALAAVLLIFAFELLRRVLSRPAIRKPRRISLPPWHPG
jgi:hypothetical protein